MAPWVRLNAPVWLMVSVKLPPAPVGVRDLVGEKVKSALRWHRSESRLCFEPTEFGWTRPQQGNISEALVHNGMRIDLPFIFLVSTHGFRVVWNVQVGNNVGPGTE